MLYFSLLHVSFSLLMLLTLFQSTSTAPLNQATHYLREYGYLRGKHVTFGTALRRFQRFSDIPVTGMLDEATLEKMRQPRCGNIDVGNAPLPRIRKHRRAKRYAIEGSYWGLHNVTYRVTRYTHSMSEYHVRRVLRRAFKVWEEFSPLKFVYKSRGAVNMEILFARGAHGDSEPFDGKGQILAHAFFPRFGGDVHFDEEEVWSPSKSSGQGIDLYAVAVHEIGHSLGLKHSNNQNAIMAPFYQTYTGDSLRLHKDDVRALNRLYGTAHSKKRTEEEDEEAEDNSAAPDICADASIDAITIIGNGSAYAFKGEYYWQMNDVSFNSGYPRRISADWKGITGPIDAAVTDSDGDSYFFKGNKYWLLDKTGRPYEGYPRLISAGLVDTPDNIDAALIWSYDDKPYFFKNDKYWKYSRWGMPKTFPRSLRSLFKGSVHTPSKINAAVKWFNGRSYIFAGKFFYRLTQWRTLHVVDGYPRDIAQWWFGCGGAKHTLK